MQKANSPKRGPGKAAKRKAALSAQQTIPYLVMHPDGVCQLPGGLYTKTVEYEDINYSVASTEDQTAIFGGWSAFLNYFDSSLPFQLSFINRRSRSRSKYKVNIPPAQDDYDSIRAEFTGKEHCITEPELQMPMESRSAYMRPPVKNYMKSSWRPGDRWMRSSFTESIRQLPSIVRNGC